MVILQTDKHSIPPRGDPYASGRHRATGRNDATALILCTTDIASAEMVGITPNGIVTQAIANAAARSKFVNPALVGLSAVPPPWFDGTQHSHLPTDEPESKLVATSGAFPGAFRLFHFDSVWKISKGRQDHRLYTLADGGIGDNLGLILAYPANHLAQFSVKARRNQEGGGAALAAGSWQLDGWLVDALIVSDASAAPVRNTRSSTLSDLGRTIDSIYLATGGDQMSGNLDSTIDRRPAILITPKTPPRACHERGTGEPIGTISGFALARDRARLSGGPEWHCNQSHLHDNFRDGPGVHHSTHTGRR